MTNLFKRLAKDESGATAIEYGLIAVGICFAILLTVPQVGAGLEAAFATVNDGLIR